MSITPYKTGPLENYKAPTSLAIKILYWIAEDPDRAIETGACLMAVGLTFAIIGSLLSK